MLKDNLNKKSADFFEENALSYSKENYDKSLNIFMFERMKSILEMTKKNLVNENKIIMDIGCGSGEINLELAKLGYQGEGVDISQTMIELAKKKLEYYPQWKFEVGSILDYNFERKYDLVIASGLIEYFKNEDTVLDNLYKIIKPNGILIINVSNIFGYSTSLNYLTHFLKNIEFVKSLKRKIMKKEYNTLNFIPKKHFIPKFKKKIEKRYKILDEEYIGFSLFPAPFSSMFNKLTHKLDVKLQKLKFTPLKYISSSYIVCIKKK